MSDALIATASQIVDMARNMGASEVTAYASEGTYTDVKQRDGSIEKWQDSQSRSASAALFVDERYSVHSTNDLRPEALKSFIQRAIEATRHLEPDPERRLPEQALMGTASTTDLDLVDATAPEIDHRTWVDEMQRTTTNAIPAHLRSTEGFVWSGTSSQAMVTSNGFCNATSTTEYGQGADVSMVDTDGRLPEAYDYAVARHHTDLPSIASIAEKVAARGAGQLGSGPVASRRGAMLVENRVAGRIIGTLIGPMNGAAIFEQRSCMSDKLDAQVAASGFSLIDAPHLARGMGSGLHDGDGRPTHHRTLVDQGILTQWLINVYYSRKLDRKPTSGGTSNLIVPPGSRSPAAILSDLDWAIKVDGFLGGNSNPATGRYSFGIRGTLYEKGVPTTAVSEMNITGSIFDLMGSFLEAADDPWLYGSTRSPSLLFDAVQFSGQ
jgi:PmbA protein